MINAAACLRPYIRMCSIRNQQQADGSGNTCCEMQHFTQCLRLAAILLLLKFDFSLFSHQHWWGGNECDCFFWHWNALKSFSAKPSFTVPTSKCSNPLFSSANLYWRSIQFIFFSRIGEIFRAKKLFLLRVKVDSKIGKKREKSRAVGNRVSVFMSMW